MVRLTEKDKWLRSSFRPAQQKGEKEKVKAERMALSF